MPKLVGSTLHVILPYTCESFVASRWAQTDAGFHQYLPIILSPDILASFGQRLKEEMNCYYEFPY